MPTRIRIRELNFKRSAYNNINFLFKLSVHDIRISIYIKLIDLLMRFCGKTSHISNLEPGNVSIIGWSKIEQRIKMLGYN